LAGHALRAAKRIFGIPNFRYYALADGIKDILSRSRRGIDVKVTGNSLNWNFRSCSEKMGKLQSIYA